MLLADIKENNQLFANVHALIIKRSNKVTKTEKPFVELLLQHDQLTMKAIKWSYNAEKYDSICVEGNVVKIDGKSNEYDGLLQITIDNMILSEKQPSDFAGVRKIVEEEEEEEICFTAGKLGYYHYQSTVLTGKIFHQNS